MNLHGSRVKRATRQPRQLCRALDTRSVFVVQWGGFGTGPNTDRPKEARQMRIRLVARDEGKFQLLAEQASRKGKRVTAGKTVSREGLRQEADRLVREVRGEIGQAG